MIGATTPFFTALLGFLISGTRETPKVYLTLVPVVVGVMISTGGEPQFHLLGLIVCLLSTAARALKSVMQGLLMSNPEEKLDSVNLLRFMAPAALLMLLPLTLIFEDVERIAGFFSPASNPKPALAAPSVRRRASHPARDTSFYRASNAADRRPCVWRRQPADRLPLEAHSRRADG